MQCLPQQTQYQHSDDDAEQAVEPDRADFLQQVKPDPGAQHTTENHQADQWQPVDKGKANKGEHHTLEQVLTSHRRGKGGNGLHLVMAVTVHERSDQWTAGPDEHGDKSG